MSTFAFHALDHSFSYQNWLAIASHSRHLSSAFLSFASIITDWLGVLVLVLLAQQMRLLRHFRDVQKILQEMKRAAAASLGECWVGKRGIAGW